MDVFLEQLFGQGELHEGVDEIHRLADLTLFPAAEVIVLSVRRRLHVRPDAMRFRGFRRGLTYFKKSSVLFPGFEDNPFELLTKT